MSPYRDAVLSLGLADRRLIGAVTATRNCIAHRSKKATDEMNSALNRLTARDRVLKRDARVTPSGVGAYLYAKTGARRWVEIYHDRLVEVAENLRTS
jgi:hypothetical protein